MQWEIDNVDSAMVTNQDKATVNNREDKDGEDEHASEMELGCVPANGLDDENL